MNEQFITSILENTIGTMIENKNSIMSIAVVMKKEHIKKRDELAEIKKQLPIAFDKTKQLRAKDLKLRNAMLKASTQFTEEGYKSLEELFAKVNEVHDAYINAEKEEYTLIRRRDALELELKQSIIMIEKAEGVARQLMISLTYLQNSLFRFNEPDQEAAHVEEEEGVQKYLEFISYVEQEKVRIARDIHDGPAQQIAGTLMNVDLCSVLLQKDPEKGGAVLAKIKQDLGNTLGDIRAILFDLNPAPIEKIGFREAIQNMLHSILNSEQVNINFFYNVGEEEIPEMKQKAIYRMVQELINNIKKHSKATEVMLRITMVNDFLYLYLMDNGIGFQVPEDLEYFRMHKKSYGISNIHTRIKEMNGTLVVNSDSTNGTSFKIQLPMNSKAGCTKK